MSVVFGAKTRAKVGERKISARPVKTCDRGKIGPQKRLETICRLTNPDSSVIIGDAVNPSSVHFPFQDVPRAVLFAVCADTVDPL